MNQRVKDLGAEALKLTPEERVGLADIILDSLEPSAVDADQAWRDEIQSRIAAFERGEFELFESGDVIADARAALPR